MGPRAAGPARIPSAKLLLRTQLPTAGAAIPRPNSHHNRAPKMFPSLTRAVALCPLLTSTTTRLASTSTAAAARTTTTAQNAAAAAGAPPKISRMHSGPKAAKLANVPKPNKPLIRAPWGLGLTVSHGFAVYNRTKAAGSTKFTVVKKIEGDARGLVTDLVKGMRFPQEDVKINPRTKHVHVKVYRPAVSHHLPPAHYPLLPEHEANRPVNRATTERRSRTG